MLSSFSDFHSEILILKLTNHELLQISNDIGSFRWTLQCTKLFELPNVSEKFNVIVTIENCSENQCNGKATVDIYDKSSMKKYQTLSSGNFYVDLNENRKPALDSLKNSVVFDDFNFDGAEDVAIRNGSNNQGNPFFEVYLNDASTQQLVLNDEFTDLVRSNSGMFAVDSHLKRITAYLKNGCCWSLTSEYLSFPKEDF